MTTTPGDRPHADPPITGKPGSAGTEGARSGTGRRSRRRSGPGAHTSLETAADAFRMLTTGPAPLALDGAAVGHGLPRRAIPLTELRTILLHPSTSRASRDAAWRQVVTNTRTRSSAWVIGAVGIALPALWKMAGDLADGYEGELADLHAAIVTGFVAGLHRIDASRPGIITRLRWAAYRAGLLARHARDAIPPVRVPAPASAPPPPPWEHPDLLLMDAVGKGVLSPLQAELIGRSRLEDISLKDAAAELGVGTQAAYKARRRGERRLVAAIAAGDVEHRVSNLSRESGLFLTRTPQPRPRRPSSKPGRSGARGADKPAGGRRESAESDGTSETDSTDEKGVFCTPARQPHQKPAPPHTRAGARRSRPHKRRRQHGHGGDTP